MGGLLLKEIKGSGITVTPARTHSLSPHYFLSTASHMETPPRKRVGQGNSRLLPLSPIPAEEPLPGAAF